MERQRINKKRTIWIGINLRKRKYKNALILQSTSAIKACSREYIWAVIANDWLFEWVGESSKSAIII